mmetsp:Transcript_20293/g.65255  ORF Transcript_20293/g.65255 Transcript_20293/m.65255 type:complete len:262 (-) Transcript_20293:1085-1870(-)
MPPRRSHQRRKRSSPDAMCATSAAIPNGMSSTCEAKPTLSTRASVDSFGASRSSCRRSKLATSRPFSSIASRRSFLGSLSLLSLRVALSTHIAARVSSASASFSPGPRRSSRSLRIAASSATSCFRAASRSAPTSFSMAAPSASLACCRSKSDGSGRSMIGCSAKRCSEDSSSRTGRGNASASTAVSRRIRWAEKDSRGATASSDGSVTFRAARCAAALARLTVRPGTSAAAPSSTWRAASLRVRSASVASLCAASRRLSS